MFYRKATISDYEALYAVRMSVHENVLVNTHLVTFKDYEEMLQQKGCGWLCEDETGTVAGFSIVDLSRNNIWALFVHPVHEGKGIGSHLHQLMLDWSFDNGSECLWLTTEPETRAEAFYLKSGWERKGIEPDGELRFEINKKTWLNKRSNKNKQDK